MRPTTWTTILRAGELASIGARGAVRFALASLRLLTKKRSLGERAYEEELWRLEGRAGRLVCEEMGPTFVKLAQILSTRRDLFPPAALEELQKLQDDVPPFAGDLVPAIFENEFGKTLADVFASFDLSPVASASVAQVHRGLLKDGREVAVKVLRPGIEEVMVRDLKLIRFLARLLARSPFAEHRSIEGFAEHFGEMLKKQLDLRIEAGNNRRFRDCFPDIPHLARFPLLVDEYCSRSVMTMEFAHGAKPTRLREGAHDLRKLAETGLYLYYRMILHGIVHADLHPGNMLVAPEGFFWIFDLGLVDELGWDVRKSFFEAWFSSFNGDGGPFARMILQFSRSHEVDDPQALEADVTAMLKERLANRRIADLSFGGIMLGIADIQRRYGIVADPMWISITVSLASVEGLARHLHPDMNVVETISPHLKKFLRTLYLEDPKLRRNARSAGSNDDGNRETGRAGFEDGRGILPGAHPPGGS